MKTTAKVIGRLINQMRSTIRLLDSRLAEKECLSDQRERMLYHAMLKRANGSLNAVLAEVGLRPGDWLQ